MQSAPERHEHILKRLREQGQVSVATLSEQLEVSEVTIRKDLNMLERRHLLHRTHGGAIGANPYVLDRTVEEKTGEHAADKDRIGRAASALVEPQDSIILGSGTTAMYVARHLRDVPGLTVITSAMNVAVVLTGLPQVEILMLGGTVRKSSTSVVGQHAEQMLEDHACSKLFLGVDGFDLDYGLTTTNAQEATLNQAMMRAAQRTIVIADSSKFGRRGFRRICNVDQVDAVITDTGVSDEAVRSLEARGVAVDVV
ncbi:MAG: transcriptional repressor AgaR [Rhodothermales bacterium]